jgi:hypothetical protein
MDDTGRPAVCRDLVFSEKKVDSIGVAVDRLLRVGQHLLEIDFRRCHPDAHAAERMLRFLEPFRGMQQRLRRYAADVEAGSAVRRSFLDHADLHPQLCRSDGAHIAAGAGADHQ